MSSTLFIADLHLSELHPEGIEVFFQFIDRYAVKAKALYILGDFFEFWLGDDDDHPLYLQMIERLATLADSGVQCYFICGNRDFLLGKRFCRAAKMTLLPDEYVTVIEGHSTLLCHGDTLCVDDLAYQKFRQICHNRLYQRIFLTFPISFRRWVSSKFRHKSKQENKVKTAEIMDVNPQCIERQFVERNIDFMIHGHTHRLAIHNERPDEQPRGKRIVLGAWEHHGSFIRVDHQGKIALCEFPFDDINQLTEQQVYP